MFAEVSPESEKPPLQGRLEIITEAKTTGMRDGVVASKHDHSTGPRSLTQPGQNLGICADFPAQTKKP